MTFIPNPPNIEVRQDAGDRTRVSQLTTLFDGKTLTADEPLLWDTQGTGTPTYQSNKLLMSVTAGQYLVRQSRVVSPYFSGKSQAVEKTFDTFDLQTGVIKRAGYFSSSITAPYTANLDGYYIESNGDDGTFYLVVVNNGVENLRLAWTQWDGYSDISSYDWDNFSVTLVDFLWLGGAVLRLFLKSPDGGFVLCHTYNYAGSAQDVFMDNPQHPVRYEIRSTTGAGSMRAICSQVASEGSLSERGEALSVRTTTALSAAASGTTYALLAIRKSATYRNTATFLRRYASVLTSVNARGGMLLLLLNPTLSAPLTFNPVSRIEFAVGTGQTVTADGRVLDAIPVDLSSVVADLAENVLASLSVGIAGTADVLVLAYTPASANQTILGSLSMVEY